MAAAVIKQGAFANGLFDIKCPDCLKDACLFACVTSPAINEKVGSPIPKAASFLGACCGCSCCLLIKYGTTLKGPLEPMPVALFKAWCCGGCYAHQLMKEPNLAGAVANAMGAPSQEEMK